MTPEDPQMLSRVVGAGPPRTRAEAAEALCGCGVSGGRCAEEKPELWSWQWKEESWREGVVILPTSRPLEGHPCMCLWLPVCLRRLAQSAFLLPLEPALRSLPSKWWQRFCLLAAQNAWPSQLLSP